VQDARTTKTGVTADSNPVPLDGLPSLSYDTANNRINSPGWEYDLAGNQTRGQNESGVWLRFEHDEAGRKVKLKDDLGNSTKETFTYNDRFPDDLAVVAAKYRGAD
jgi:hypothetical protein